MDLQTRKIEFIQEFLKLQSEEAISRLEKLLKKEKKETEKSTQPITVEQLNRRIDKSMEDSKKGKLTESNNLLREIEKWS